MITCPHCRRSTQQVKNGRTPAGSQRYLCRVCRRKYTPDPRPQGYGADLRRRAVQRYVARMNLRRTGRALGVVHQTVANWVAAHAATQPAQPPAPSAAVETAGLDELFTFVGHKKRCLRRHGGSPRHALHPRQRHTCAFPRQACHVMDFACP
ncbi:MAG TPA: IS1 family transposase [Chloroflexota bacterium]|nr:IS1 family transposase [Chloroflexota bacterium]